MNCLGPGFSWAVGVGAQPLSNLQKALAWTGAKTCHRRVPGAGADAMQAEPGANLSCPRELSWPRVQLDGRCRRSAPLQLVKKSISMDEGQYVPPPCPRCRCRCNASRTWGERELGPVKCLGPGFSWAGRCRRSLKRVIVTPAVYPRLVESLHFDIQSTGCRCRCRCNASRTWGERELAP